MASVAEKRNVAAKDVASLSVTAKGTAVLENGFVFTLGAQDSDHVFAATQPATGNLGGAYMVFSSEKPQIFDERGNGYRITNDPRDLEIPVGQVFDAFKLKQGDIIALTAEAFGNTRTAENFVEVVNGSYQLSWVSSATAGSTALQLIQASDRIRVPKGSFPPSSYVDAFLFRVIQE